MRTITIGGSYGTLEVYADTGRVMTYTPDHDAFDPEEPGDYWDIVKFDMAELVATYGAHEFARCDYWDILDVGYWARDERGELTFTEPEWDWRQFVEGLEDGPPTRTVIALPCPVNAAAQRAVEGGAL